jgi:hypothetical protein
VARGEAGEEILDTYEPERIGFARRLVATTDRIFTFVTRRARLAALVRTRIAPVVLPFLFRFAPVRRFQFRTVAQTGIRYRESALSEGSAGSVHGGDRLPWVGGEGGDNFAPLTSMQWQVHVYGEPRAGVAEACEALGLSLFRFPWRRATRKAGLARDAVYLVRPDAYVALAAVGDAANRLRRYFERRPDLRPVRKSR